MSVRIGIDPDVDKNGVAFKDNEKVELSNLTFFQLFDYLLFVKNRSKNQDVLIVIEAGWLNKGNWHKVKNGTASINAKIGNNTGRNHETGRKIVEMIEYLKLPYKLVKPNKAKIKSDFFRKITGIQKSNQEQRDAYMLIHELK